MKTVMLFGNFVGRAETRDQAQGGAIGLRGVTKPSLKCLLDKLVFELRGQARYGLWTHVT